MLAQCIHRGLLTSNLKLVSQDLKKAFGTICAIVADSTSLLEKTVVLFQ